MDAEITIKNYRCFSDQNPVSIILRKGFTSFVGVNNSGKSTPLRFFYEFRHLFAINSNLSGNLLSALRGIHQSFDARVVDIEEIFCNANDRDLEIQVHLLEQSPAPGFPPIVFTIPRNTNRWTAKLLLEGYSWPPDQLTFYGEVLKCSGSPLANFSNFFKVCQAISNAIYIGSFRNVINIGSDEQYFDIRIGEAFIKQWRSLKTGNIKKHNEAIKKLTNDICSLFSFKNLEINASDDGRNLQIFINDKSFKLSELGSGIAQFILVLANAATLNPSYILIDGPELSLHPSLQLDFLTTLASYASEGILFATHNIGLARASSERVYSVRKVSDFESQVAQYDATPRLSEFLGELSFFGYKELGFDKILLVEGPKEVKTIQQFLRLYKKDHKIVLLPLGGNSLINGSPTTETQLEEIKRISENISALIDSERTASDAQLAPARDSFVKLCAKTGIRCHVLERRAIENYLTDQAVKKVKGNNYQALSHYQKLEDLSPTWGKSEIRSIYL